MADNSSSKKKTTKKKSGGKNIGSDLRSGRTISLRFFRKNGWLLSLIVLVMLALMGLRFKTKNKMKEINTLEIMVDRSQSEKLKCKSEYMTLIRESEMRRLVDSKGLGLVFQEQPPYELTPEKR